MTTDLLPEGIYIDPPSPAYYDGRLFDLSDATLNRDDSLLPYARVRDSWSRAGVITDTADRMPGERDGRSLDYYSLGVLDNFSRLARRRDVRMRAFVIFEPPVVEPRLYRALPELTAVFERVYVHNTVGDGYSLDGVDASRLRQLYWPQPRREVIEPWWSSRNRMNRLVVINGNHVPRKVPNELYSRRLEAMAELASSGDIDLYGRGWTKWKARTTFWWPYISRRSTVLSIYKGPCASKYEVMSQYRFCLCLENLAMRGYITEKIFDCFYSGIVPLYLGAPDISSLLPEDAYIDCRKFPSWTAGWSFAQSLPQAEVDRMRESGRTFVSSLQGARYYDSLMDIFETPTRGSI